MLLFEVPKKDAAAPVFKKHYTREEIIIGLLQGWTIADLRVRNTNHETVVKLRRKTFENMRIGKHAIMVKKKGYWIISRKKVRALDGRSYIKKAYRKFMKQYCQPANASKIIPQ